ncbi:acyl-CoA synthetase [soil metagenome]
MSGIGHYARMAPEATAIVTAGSVTTFAELDERQRSLGGLLADLGVRRGDRIAVLAHNRPELLEITGGALRCGIIPVPVSPLLTPRETRYLLEDSGARWLFADRSFPVHPGLEGVVTFGDAYERAVTEASLAKGVADVALGRPMHYTSGTTGQPKGVWVEPHDAEQASAILDDFRRLWGLTSDDVFLGCAPLSHSAPHRFALRTLETGGTLVLQAGFAADEALAAIELFGVTSSFMVPTHLERILALGERTLRRHDLSTMRLLVHGGAPIREATKRKVLELFPPGSVWELYGTTEGQGTRIRPDEWLRRPGSVGRALPGAAILILDEDGRLLPAGATGQVWIKDPRAERFRYWEDDGKTDSAWHVGAFTAGDLGHLDGEDYLYLTGRAADTIISGGVNVYPEEVELVLLEHPSIVEAAVYGIEHPDLGEQVAASIVLSDRSELDRDELVGWVRRRLAGPKRPRQLRIVRSLPRTPTGKLLRRPPD